MQAANATAASITAAINAEQKALADYNAAVLPSSSLEDGDELLDVQGKLSAAGIDLGEAGGSLTEASTALTNAANAFHTGFQIRAPVSPDDQEYIVVVASQAPATDLNVNIQFHGAIDTAAAAASIADRLRAGCRAGIHAPHLRAWAADRGDDREHGYGRDAL